MSVGDTAIRGVRGNRDFTLLCLVLTPPQLRGRVQAASAFISGAVVWAGPIGIGVLFQDAGETAAVLALVGWTALVALAGTLSRGFRMAPGAPALSS